MKNYRLITLIFLCLTITACMPPPSPPRHALNACHIFEEYPNWYFAAKKSQQKWGVPVSVQMAIIFQESSFKADAKPPRGKLLWIIPWKRPTSASGYAQVIDETWYNYKKQTHHTFANRENIKDATDFIGWYGSVAHQKLHISKYNAYELYLAYHEGMGGYARGTYRKKPWLIQVAHKVQGNARLYQKQLSRCEWKIKKSWF